MTVPDAWYRDPFGAHELRYYRDGAPTGHVSDAGVVSYEPPPASTDPGGAGWSPVPAASPWTSTPGLGSPPSAAIPVDFAVGGAGQPIKLGRRRRWARPTLGAGVAALVALVVLLVLSPFGTGDAAAVLATSAQHTEQVGTATMDAQVSVSASGRSAVIDINGPADFSSHTFDFQISSQSASGEVRGVGGDVYLSLPQLSLPGGAQWVEITPADAGGAVSGTSSYGELPFEGMQFLSQVDGAHVVGTDTIDGVSVTHYAFSINLGAVLSGMQQHAGKLDPQLAQGLDTLKRFVDLSHIPGDAWIDAQGLLRRVGFDLTLAVGGFSVQESAVISFSRFGSPVTVTAPPPGSVVPLSAVPGGLGQASGVPS